MLVGRGTWLCNEVGFPTGPGQRMLTYEISVLLSISFKITRVSFFFFIIKTAFLKLTGSLPVSVTLVRSSLEYVLRHVDLRTWWWAWKASSHPGLVTSSHPELGHHVLSPAGSLASRALSVLGAVQIRINGLFRPATRILAPMARLCATRRLWVCFSPQPSL